MHFYSKLIAFIVTDLIDLVMFYKSHLAVSTEGALPKFHVGKVSSLMVPTQTAKFLIRKASANTRRAKMTGACQQSYEC